MAGDHTPSSQNSIEYMRDAVLFDGPDSPRRLSRFWILLTLSSVIAAGGVVGDSTATVIGAMIVAPMMLPIQGAMLSTVLGDQSRTQPPPQTPSASGLSTYGCN